MPLSIFIYQDDFFFFFGVATAFLKVLPAVNLGTVLAAIFNASPVCGCRPVRAARLVDLNVPNPGSTTVSPLATVATTLSIMAFNALAAVVLVISAWAAIWSISSDLNMLKMLLLVEKPAV